MYPQSETADGRLDSLDPEELQVRDHREGNRLKRVSFMHGLLRAAAVVALAAAASTAVAEADIKPWKGKPTLPLARSDLEGRMR